MLRRLLPKKPAFESRTGIWREVGLGSEIDHDEVVVKIVSTPLNPGDGANLAEEVMAGVRTAEGRGDGDGRANGASR